MAWMNRKLDVYSEEFDAPFRRPSQERGAAKFDRILDAAHAFIIEKGYNEFTMAELAERAGVAKGSAYHFFPNLEAVYIALVERFDQSFIDIVSAPIEPSDIEKWSDVIDLHFDRSRQFINNNPPALILIIGPGRTWETRLKDAAGDSQIAHFMVETLERFFILPKHPPPQQLLHMCIQILNGLWELSVVEHGHVTDDFARETKRAVTAYVGQYWPTHLERRGPAEISLDE